MKNYSECKKYLSPKNDYYQIIEDLIKLLLKICQKTSSVVVVVVAAISIKNGSCPHHCLY